MRRWIVSLVVLLLTAGNVRAATQNDVILGNGSAGPYTLTYRGIQGSSASVSRNGLIIVSGLDYKLDAAQGQCTFSQPLGAKSSALVQYQYEPMLAQRTNSQIVLPVKVDLENSGRQDLFVSARYQQSASQTASGPTNLTLGFGSMWRGSGHNQAGLRLFLAPQVSSGNPQQQHGAAATGLALDTTAEAGRGSLITLGYNRAASGIADPDAGLQPGSQLLTLGLHMAPVSFLHADVGYKHTDSLESSALPTTVSSASVTVAATPTVQVTAHESQTTQGDQAQQQTGVGVALNKDQALSLNTGIDVYHAPTASRQVTSVTGRVRPVPVLEINAAYQSRDADLSDTDVRHRIDTTDMRVSWQSRVGFKVTGRYGQNPTDPNGDPMPLTRRGIGLESELGRIRLTGGYDWSQPIGSTQNSTELRLGLGWKLSRSGQVIGFYTQSIGAQYSVQTQWLNTYSLGYQHTLGDMFNLSLMGTLHSYPGTEINTVPVYSTTANVGLKF